MIQRDPSSAAAKRFDVAVVGGGVYGIAVCLEAARRGLATLLIERGDFGGETSWNSLRIVHGGLRYLQTADISRFRESVRERRWWMQTYPELVQSLPCVMPLYGRGLRRPSVLRLALTLNDALTANRNRGIRPDRRLGRGRILSPAETRAMFPDVDLSDLDGAALWFDATMPSSERLLIEMLRWANASGAVSLNQVKAVEILTQKDNVVGLVAEDALTGSTLEFQTRTVVNCAGPWSQLMASTFDKDLPGLFTPSLAFNLLLDLPSLGDAALALAGGPTGEQTYFLCPWHGKLLAGTFHHPWPQGVEELRPPASSVTRFIEDLRQILGGLELSDRSVLLVQAGLLPGGATGKADLAKRPVLHHHQDFGGPAGLFSVAGVKFTTSRAVAQRTLERICGFLGTPLPAYQDPGRPPIREVPSWQDFEDLSRRRPDDAVRLLNDLVQQESVLTLGDLILRRTTWWSEPRRIVSRAETIGRLLDWNPIKLATDLDQLKALEPG